MELHKKVIISPKLITYLNNMENDNSQDVVLALYDLVKELDKILEHIAPEKELSDDLNEPRPAIWVKEPHRVQAKRLTSAQLKAYADKTANMSPNFKENVYKDVVRLATANKNPNSRHFKKFVLFKTELPIDAIMVDPSHDNKIVDDTKQCAKDVHVTVGFVSTDDIEGGLPFDLPMIKGGKAD